MRNLFRQVQKRFFCSSTDYALLWVVLILIGVGCFFIYDFTVVSDFVPDKNYYLIRQMLFALCGVASMIILSKIDYYRLGDVLIPLLVSVIVVNVCYHNFDTTGFFQGKLQYLTIGTLSIHVGQLTEMVSLLILARFLSYMKSDSKAVFFAGIYALFACFLLILTQDSKNLIALLVVTCILIFLRTPWSLLFTCCLFIIMICIFGAATEYTVSFIQHIRIWLNPFSDFYNLGYPVIQSIYAIADGGMFGVGVGAGMMRYCIEDTHSTFILPAITQEIGIVGTAVILLIYLFFLLRAFRITRQTVDKWGFYLAAAITVRYGVILSMYLLVRVNIIPQINYLTLPFFSYGSSLIIDCCLVGILLSIRRYRSELNRR